MFKISINIEDDVWKRNLNSSVFKNFINPELLNLILKISRKQKIYFYDQILEKKSFIELKNFGCDIKILISFIDDEAMSKLNYNYRKKEGSTNVLSFSYCINESKSSFYLGEIFCAFQTISKEAIDQGKDFYDHLRHLILHGILHLLGYDHIEEKDAVTMEALEVKILKKYFILNPYLQNDCD